MVGLMSSLSHAEREFEILKSLETEENLYLISEFKDEILAIVKKFEESGQSGGSAPYTANAIKNAIGKLLLYQTISPITGQDDEWNDISYYAPDEGVCFQNNRNSAIFKDNTGSYYINAIVWQGEDEWDSFTGWINDISSAQNIKSFPFEPRTFRIDVIREPYNKDKHNSENAISCSDGDYVYKVKDEKQLDEVFEYYNKRPKYTKTL